MGEGQLGVFLRAMKMRCLGRLLEDQRKMGVVRRMRGWKEERGKVGEIVGMRVRGCLWAMRVECCERGKVRDVNTMLKEGSLGFLVKEALSMKKLSEAQRKISKKEISKRYHQRATLRFMRTDLVQAKTHRFKQNLAS